MSEQPQAGAPGRGTEFVPDHAGASSTGRARRGLRPAQGVFRPAVSGGGERPAEGPVLIAPIHRSNLDFAFTCSCRRARSSSWPRTRLRASRLLGDCWSHLGAFPVQPRARRTARRWRSPSRCCAAGQALVLFPEGTRKEGRRSPRCTTGADVRGRPHRRDGGARRHRRHANAPCRRGRSSPDRPRSTSSWASRSRRRSSARVGCRARRSPPRPRSSARRSRRSTTRALGRRAQRSRHQVPKTTLA